MRLFGKSEPRRKSRVVPAKHESTAEETAVTGLLYGEMAEDVHARIAVLAFQFYEQRGRRDGHDVEDWLQAERRILAGS